MKEKLSTQYNDAVKQIKTAILQSQAKALKGVNQEQLALYYGIGRYIYTIAARVSGEREPLRQSANSCAVRYLG